MSKTRKSTSKNEKIRRKTLETVVQPISFCLGQHYTLNRSENCEEFLQEFDLKKNTRIKALNSVSTIVLTKKENDYVLTTNYSNGKEVKVEFQIGKQIQRLETIDYDTTSVFRIEGNKLIEEQYISDTKVVIIREFKKKELVVTMTVNGVQCQKFYVLTSPRYSIGTETSRRPSFWEIETPVQSLKIDETKESTSSKNSEEDVCY